MDKRKKSLNGLADGIIDDISRNSGVRLDKDKVEFLQTISKTKYSGLTTIKLVDYLSLLKDKNDDWYKEMLDDGLVEKLNYKPITSKVRQNFEGWFITPSGRKILKKILKEM